MEEVNVAARFEQREIGRLVKCHASLKKRVRF